MIIDTRDYLGLGQWCAVVGINYQFARDMIAAGRIPHIKVVKTCLIHKDQPKPAIYRRGDSSKCRKKKVKK
jgi:hypothetical protein